MGFPIMSLRHLEINHILLAVRACGSTRGNLTPDVKRRMFILGRNSRDIITYIQVGSRSGQTQGGGRVRRCLDI